METFYSVPNACGVAFAAEPFARSVPVWKKSWDMGYSLGWAADFTASNKDSLSSAEMAGVPSTTER